MAGLGPQIKWFFAMQGIVSIFMPTLMGIVADRFIPAQKTLSLCHGLAGLFMLGAGFYCMSAGDAVAFAPLFVLYSVSVAFYMPTIAISNSVAYNALGKAGMDPVTAYPPLRVFGTVGFIASMLLTNFIKIGGVAMQDNYNQLFFSGILSIVLCAYALSMPACDINRGESKSLAEAFGLKAFSLFKQGQFAIFFIFSMLLGASLQITNGYANTFLGSFAADPALANTFAVKNSNALIAISQASETLCILLIPICMKRFGIKKVMLMAMFAWVFRFGFFGAGNPAMPGVLLQHFRIALCQREHYPGHPFQRPGCVYADDQRPGSHHRHSLRRSSRGRHRLQCRGSFLVQGLVHLCRICLHSRPALHDSVQRSPEGECLMNSSSGHSKKALEETLHFSTDTWPLLPTCP